MLNAIDNIGIIVSNRAISEAFYERLGLKNSGAMIEAQPSSKDP